MKKFIHIKTKTPTKICINGNDTYLNQVDIFSTHDFFVAFFPDSSRELPAILNTSTPPPNGVKIIPFYNHHFNIIYDPAIIPNNFTQNIVLHKKYKNHIFTVMHEEASFISIIGTNFSHNSSVKRLNNVNFSSNEGIVEIQGKIDVEKTYLIIFNTRKQKVELEGVFDKVEKKNGTLKALKLTDSICGYGQVYEYSFLNKKLSTYSVYGKTVMETTIPQLIPLVFMEAIKYKDYKKAKTYLQKADVSDEHLKSYFGDIKNIYYNGYSEDINYTVETSEYKSYTFSVIDGKIVDIDEISIN